MKNRAKQAVILVLVLVAIIAVEIVGIAKMNAEELEITPNHQTLEAGDVYEDISQIKLGGVDVTQYVKIEGNVDTSKVGRYVIKYTYRNKTAQKEVEVVDTTPPDVTLINERYFLNNIEELDQQDLVQYKDNVDVNCTLKRQVVQIDDNTYDCVVTVMDKAGNVTSKHIPVKIIKGQIYLTFDDGPSELTHEVLRILEETNINATFFVVNFKEQHRSTIAKLIEDGNTLGIHGYSHDYGKIYASDEDLQQNFIRLQQKIQEELGYEAKFIRFPGGASNTVSKQYCEGIMARSVESMTDLGFTFYDWNVDSNDAGADKKSPSNIVENVKAGIQPGRANVVLLHDGEGHEATVEAVQEIIEWGQEEGYQFLPITDETPLVQHPTFN